MVLELKQVYKKYRENVLSDINFVCRQGEAVCLAGANGSGKSTLLSILCGVIRPSCGEVSNNVQIGYVPQECCLFMNSSVKDNIDFWAAAKKTKPDYSAFRASDMKKRVKLLSVGMKKRLSIAVALLGNYDFLVLDEPTASLDINDQNYVMDVIRENQRLGKGVIYTSHNVSEIAIGQRLYILNKGRIVFEGITDAFHSLEEISELLRLQIIIHKGE